MNPTHKVAIVVHACDRYNLLFKGFEYFFSKYWSNNIHCNYYFATEEADTSMAGFKNIKSGKGKWSKRLSILLSEKIKEDYILYFQEDMWLNKKVNPDFFNQLFELSITNNWKQVKLHSSEVYVTKPTNLFIEGFNVSEVDNIKSDFLMSHQVTLWNKHFLVSQLKQNEHPWRNERRGTKRLKKLDPLILQIDYFAENGKEEINNNKTPVGRSEYRTISCNAQLNEDSRLFIEKLMNEGAHFRQYASLLLHHFTNKLTHDEMPPPKRQDLFKKIKKWYAALI